jgi:hypothetical protein
MFVEPRTIVSAVEPQGSELLTSLLGSTSLFTGYYHCTFIARMVMVLLSSSYRVMQRRVE